MATSQSDTKWFKKGSKLPDGTIAKKSLVWNTKTGKRQQGAVSISTSSGGVKKGTTVKYKAGSNRGTVKKKPAAAGGGVMPGKPASKRTASKPTTTRSTTSRPTSKRTVKATTVTRGDGTKTKITTSKPTKKGGDTGAMAPRPGEYQAGRGQTAKRSAGFSTRGSGGTSSGRRSETVAQAQKRGQQARVAGQRYAGQAGRAPASKPKTGGSTSWAGEIGKAVSGFANRSKTGAKKGSGRGKYPGQK